MTPNRRWLAIAVVFLAACRDGTLAPSLNPSQKTANVDVGVQAGNLDINGYFNGAELQSLQLSACYFTTTARHTVSNSTAQYSWTCGTPLFTNLAPGSYDVSLGFAPNFSLKMADPANAMVTAGATSVLDLETASHVGMVTGKVMVNGSPASNLTICANSGQTGTVGYMQQCGWIGFNQEGRFRFLVPAGSGAIEIKGQNYQTLALFPYTTAAGATVDIGTLAVSLGDLSVKTLYNGAELHTLGLSACYFNVRARHVATNTLAQQSWICSSYPITNTSGGLYDVDVTFAPNQSVAMSAVKQATVNAGAVTNLDVETSGHVGMVTGLATQNGVLTQSMNVCATTGQGTAQQMQQCGWIGGQHNGRFKLLVPPGTGTIELKGQNYQTLLSAPFTAVAGGTIDLGTLNVAVGDLSFRTTYEGVDIHSMQLTGCYFTVRARHVATGADAMNSWFCAPYPFMNLLPGDYQLSLGFAWNQNLLLADPVAATVTAATTSSATIETSEKVGLLTGTITLNGEPGANLEVCLESAAPNYMNQCGWIYQQHAGAFKFLVPKGCGVGRVYGGGRSLLATFQFCLEAGEEKDVGNPVEPSDDTAPVITPTVTGTLGSNGWYTSDVSVTWSATDAESEITTPACPDESVTANTTASGVTFSCTATSEGGTDTKSVTIKRDASAPAVSPTVTGTMGNGGWYTSDVEVSWSTTDGESGIASSSGCSLAGVLADVDGASFTCTATNGAGLSASDAVSVKRDATAPTVSFTGSSGSYTVDQMVSIACSASDAMSQLASSSCPSVSKAAYEFPLGTNTLSASAEDNAGNRASATEQFEIRATANSVCALVERWVANKGVANSLCVKLRNGSSTAFANELSAQSGKHVPADKVGILSALSSAL